MDNYSFLYWVTRLDNIRFALILSSSLSVIASAFLFVASFVLDDYAFPEEKAKADTISKHASRFGVAFLVLLLVSVFIPSRNDMLIIYAGGKTLNYVQGDTSLSKLPYQTTAIISGYMDKALRELKEDEK